MKKVKKIFTILLCCMMLFGCKSKEEKLFDIDGIGNADLSGMDLSDYDLRDYEKELYDSNFDMHTIWPKKIPIKFDSDKLISLGKNPGMNIKQLHKEGIDGKKIGIAIIDQPLLSNHNEFKNNLKYYYNNLGIGEKKDVKPYFHGTAVASLAVGKNVGTAPGADLYFIGNVNLIGIGASDEEIIKSIAIDIDHIISLNKRLKDKIRIISISKGFSKMENYSLIEDAIYKAKQNNIEVITGDVFDGESIGMLIRRKNYADPDKASSYEPSRFMGGSYSSAKGFSVPMDCRTVASETGVNDYEYTGLSGISWAIPYLAGVYALALQVKPNLSFDSFLEIAVNTAESETVNVISPYNIINYLKKEY